MGRPQKSTSQVAFGKELGHSLKRERESRQLTGEQLAQTSRVSLDQIRKIEQGRAASPGIYTVARLAGALGISIDSITPAVGNET